ncbi:hypothetical protein ACQPXM_32965 [Kribbella sp. CA-253562]|uniref:hypothetical protein n=1 Tax=Kribbella sp. CA-253562 TaxID=3239942 RepID=UPI003D92CEE2
MSYYLPNDGRYPVYAAVWTPYPLFTGSTELDEPANWPWLYATILGQSGPDEWHLLIEAPELIEIDDNGVEWLPTCCRNGNEILILTWTEEQR